MNPTSFKNCIPKFFLTAEENEKRALEKIERQRQEREQEKGIALRCAGLTDAVDSARENFDIQCRKLDEVQSFTPENLAEAFLAGQKIEDISTRLVAVEKLQEKLPQIKAALHKLLVGTAEKYLADFQKANRAVLSKFPKLERAADPVFVSAELSPDHYTGGASSKLAAAAVIK